MTMTSGTVTVTGLDGAGDVVRTGSGFALDMFDWLVQVKASLVPAMPPAMPILGRYDGQVGGTGYPQARPVQASDIDSATAGRLAYFKDLASTVTGLSFIITYIKFNAVVDLTAANAHVTTQRLGYTPNPNDPELQIVGPTTMFGGIAVDIPLTGTGSIT